MQLILFILQEEYLKRRTGLECFWQNCQKISHPDKENVEAHRELALRSEEESSSEDICTIFKNKRRRKKMFTRLENFPNEQGESL